MKVKVKVRAITENLEVMNACRVTVWKEALNKEPSEVFMDNIYKAEHSPIRDKWFVIEITDIPYWVSTHFVRHSIGYTPYVSTQREDRIEYEGVRGDRKQGELVNMRITLNAQAFINISRKRLCSQASPETQYVWRAVIANLHDIDKELSLNCVPECVYRGFCPELYPCGRTDSPAYRTMRNIYIGNRPKIEGAS